MPRVVFTEQEKRAIGSAALAVWQYIGDDVIQSVAMCEGISPESVEIKRAAVVEMVIDADRLTDRLKDIKHPGLAEKFEALDYEKKQRMVRAAFPYTRYGL